MCNKEFVNAVDKNFIAVASDDVAFNELPDELKAKGEFQFLKNALTQAPLQIHQGIYAVTSSGHFLGKIDSGSPIYDARESLANLKKIQGKYEKMQKSERVGKALLTSERSLIYPHASSHSEKVKLYATARHYPFADMKPFDIRHPQFSERNSEWLTNKEIKYFLPDEMKLGTSSKNGGVVMKKLLAKSHFQFACEAWWEEHISTVNLKIDVRKITSQEIFIRYQANAIMDADSKWNKSKLSTQILGESVWDRKLQQFSTFELLGLSDVELGELKGNMHRGETKRTKVAALLRLAQTDYEKSILPEGLE